MADITVSSDIDDFMQSADDAAARTALGLGTAALAATGDFATSAQGATADTALQPSDIGTMATQDADAVDITNGSATLSNLTCGNVDLTGGSISDFVSGVLHPSDIGTLVLAPDGDASALTNIPNPFDQSLNVADSPSFAAVSGVTFSNGSSNSFQLTRGTAQFVLTGGSGLAGASFDGVSLGTAAGSNTSAFQAADADLTSWAAVTRAAGFDTFAATALGTGVATVLATAGGTTGGLVVFNGALGTPSNGTLTNCTGTATGLTAGNATKWTTGRTIALTGDVTYTSPSLDGSGNVTAAATLAATSNTTLTSLANLVTVGTLTGGSTGAGFTVALSASTITGTLAAARLPSSGVHSGDATGTFPTVTLNAAQTGITSVGTLTGGATGAGFTIALTTSTVTGTIPAANTAALTGDVTKSAGSNATTIATVANVVAGTLAAARGGTGVSNTGTITLAGNLVTTGAFNTTFAQAASVTITLPATSATMATTGTTVNTGHLLFTDNTYDIGASGANRPRNLYISGFIAPAGNCFMGSAAIFDWSLRGNFSATADGVFKFQPTAASSGVQIDIKTTADTLKLKNFANNADGNFTCGAITASTTLAATGASTLTGAVTCAATLRLGNYVVSGLPAAATAGVGATAFVTDGSTTIILGLGVAVVGGGSNKVPVYSDGSSWIVG